jgi:hypothetical protein
VVFVGLDGRSEERIDTPSAHHAVAQLGVHGARFAYLAGTVREVDGEEVMGDRIVEVADDGTEREVWNAFDQLPVVRTDGWDTRTVTGEADWTHANGLYYDPDSDAYYLSTYFLGQVFKIDRATGATIWRLGGTDSDFAFVDDAGFAHQHAPEVHGDTLYVFDNGAPAARAVAYTLDTDAWTATKTWEWQTPEGSRVGVLGDVDELPDDQLLTAWGDLGQLAVVGRDGSLHWRLDTEPGVILGKAQQIETLYP